MFYLVNFQIALTLNNMIKNISYKQNRQREHASAWASEPGSKHFFDLFLYFYLLEINILVQPYIGWLHSFLRLIWWSMLLASDNRLDS